MKLTSISFSVLLFFFLFSIPNAILAQSYTISNGSVTTCTGTFYDSGGSAGQYGINENYTYTICPGSAGQAVSVNFTAFRTQSASDVLTIYDGSTTAAPIWAILSGNLGTAGPYTASSNNPFGCLTFKFTSDGTNGTAANSAGWQAVISCVSPGSPPPNPDCVNKKALCGTTSLTDNSNGAGFVADLNAANGGCFTANGTNETQSSWYSFTMANSGTFNFVIAPQNGTDDDDWALWGPNPTCPPSAAPLRCTVMCYGSFVNCSGTSAPSANTGMNATSVDVSESPSVGDGFVKQINVIAGETYILMVNNATSSNSGFQISFGGTASLTNCPLLPIELLDFTARTEQKNIRLEWRTATEINSAYYQVERSVDGSNFEPMGNRIKAAGNSNNLRLYSTFDEHPLPGTSYYRLREVDNDGNFKLSSIQTILSGAIAAKLLNIYPNPLSKSTASLDADFICELNGLNVQVELKNTLGQSLYSTEQQMTQGYNKISLPISSLNMQEGLYLLQIISRYQTLSYKIVVK